jgi:predicted esterase
MAWCAWRTRLALVARVRPLPSSPIALLASLSFALAAGCGSSDPPGAVDAGDDAVGDDGGDDTGPGDPDAAGPEPDAMVSTPDAGPAPRFKCYEPPPAGSPMPTAPPLPAAGCPTLAPGLNTITSGADQRQFILVAPTEPIAGEVYPVLFAWHWIGGDAEDFLERGQIQAAVDDQRFLGVIPVDKGAEIFGTLDTRWPFDITQPQTRMDEEFQFFDDMLACVEAQYAVNESCVSSVGVSAGALFNAQLAQARSNRLASFISLSGGVGATWIKPWLGATHKLPALVLWGGDGPPDMDGVKDILGCFSIGMDFSVASRELETGLVGGGHFLVECKHNCGHVEPPLEAPDDASKYASIWEFALDHPYWLADGDSPYLTDGLPENLPAWCAIGADSCTPRSGDGCPMAENPCAF